ncbi:MAG: orotidine-5'-phosphate decarboxylase [Actinomycetes bacterium]|jgi:orotidine 5'-phosphate decarboxylase subfamily 2
MSPASSGARASPDPFGARVRAALDARGPLCVGIDPHPELLAAWGLPESVGGLEQFAMTVVDALADRVAVVKPQSAFFERFGSGGIAVLERVLAAARASGALVLLDAKRGDIGSTVSAYARAYLHPESTLFADAVTASPYLGYESLRPLLDTAHRHGGGVFVLAYTSNPEGLDVQRSVDGRGAEVGARVLAAVATDNAGVRPLGSIGAVVGATVGRVGYDLAGVNGPLLAPGLGTAQGGTPAGLRSVFGAALPNVVPSVSREVLAHGRDRAALRRAADRLVGELDDLLR